jgi:hypothetical protein
VARFVGLEDSVVAHFSTAQPGQVEQAATSRLSNGRWAKGTSGNPSGHAASLVEPCKRRQATLFAAIVDDFGGELSPLHQEYARLASRQLARAARTKDDAVAVRLTNGAAKLLDLIRQGRERKATAKPVNAFDEYLHQRNGNGVKP